MKSSSYLRNLSIPKNVIVSDKVGDLFNPSLNFYKHYVIIPLIVVSSFFSILVPPFAENQLNISYSMINSTDEEKNYNKTNNFFKQLKYAEAIQYYDKALAIEPNDVDVLNNKGLALYNQQKYDESIQYYDKVLAIDPTNIYALNSKGLALYNQQKYDESIQYYDKALAIEPNDVDVLNNKGLALYDQQKYDESIQVL